MGISDPSSSAAIPGLVDQAQFARCNQAIATACQTLLNMASTQQQVLASATIIAKHTSLPCNACKQASSKTSNPVTKKHFVQVAKEVANSTANLVKNIKVCVCVCVGECVCACVCTQCICVQSFSYIPYLTSSSGLLSEENCQACASTTRPLLDAVEALT